MEVVAATPSGSSPFHNHDVREWARLDSLTGVLERARLETDHWTANTGNSSHKYNKVVDSRARSGADGNLQQQARRKLEVFQSQVPGGRLQVIKTQTVSSSRWTNNKPDEFQDLKLSVNPLDLSSEKSKASVGRSGRRPPSRSILAHRVSRLCHQVHNDAVSHILSQEPREDGDGVEVVEVEEKRSLTRTKSTSSEELHDKKSLEDLEDLEQLQSWRRTSKLRRSLQYKTKPPDLPENTGSVRKIREDIETGRRLSTALRGNNVDLEALDQILKSIGNEEKEKKSFVTVESIQAVKDRLRRTSSPAYNNEATQIRDRLRPIKKEEEPDDGIVTEENNMDVKVKSYIYGMGMGTGSLESRQKPQALHCNRNEDWFNRRKSYGFEQMHSQQESISSKAKIESSTDSGICRSSEIVVVPTPTKTAEDNISNVRKYAMIFEKKKEEPWRRKDFEATTIKIPIFDTDKRHSIAVDEFKYMNKLDEDVKKSNKKVEFCKTEVHFAADSGRVNIVETDEKPPPTQNFRRRRRNSGLTEDLPVLHFGDTSYEKLLFGDPDHEAIYENLQNTVTVNANSNFEIEESKNQENEAPKGILKNKPIKPKPYILGESDWGVKLRSKEEAPLWRSTVTLRSEDQNEFQKLLKQLRPTKLDEEDRRSSWSVADRIKQVEDLKWTENKGYSTKVNFGDGEATVVENRHPTWPRREDYKDSKNELNKSLVVRIGRNSGSKHTVCSKITNGTTTTTKITIDLTPSPTEYRSKFKSPALIMNVVKDEKQIPQQLEALKKLYDDVQSDSEADKEVHQIMASTGDVKEDGSSVVSGSWSKMRAFKHISHYQKVKNGSHALIEKDTNTSQPTKDTNSKFHLIDAQIENDLKHLNEDVEILNLKYSPVPLRKPNLNQKLSSPYLVSQKSPVKDKVLRQPKKSEMAYFGVKVSPKPIKKETKLTEKPDLLQFEVKEKNPIYENIEDTRRKFDSSILEELTKAADQILQAVNGYTDEDHKFSSEEEKPKLETILETKSWKKQTNSSIDSKVATKTYMTKSAEQKQRKKVVTSETAQKASTKARRLQRASSREALLQSHGSSSEDLAANVVEVVRKPRLVKKTKTTQLTITNGPEMKKPTRKKEEVKEDRVPVVGLPEIRHRTAVSTIRSTAEKQASREKARKNDKRNVKNEVTKGSSTSRTEKTRSTNREALYHRHTSVSNQKRSSRGTDTAKH